MELSLEVQIPKTPLFEGRGAQVVSTEMLAATEAGVKFIRAAIVPLVPVNTAALRGSVQTDVHGTPVGVTGRVFTPLANTYGLPMERGATWPDAGPPAEALQLWVRRRLDVPDNKVAGVAFVIARALKARGLKARNFFADGWAFAKPQVMARFEQALARIKGGL